MKSIVTALLLSGMIIATSEAALPPLSVANVVGQAMKTSTPPVIDGVMEDAWLDSTEYGINSYVNFGDNSGVPPENDADLSGKWRALWDEEYLYIIIEAKDDVNVFANLNSFNIFTSTAYTRNYGEFGATGYDLLSDNEIRWDVVNNPVIPRHGLYSSANANFTPFIGAEFTIIPTTVGYTAEIKFTWESLMTNSAETHVTWNPATGEFSGGITGLEARNYIGFEVMLQDDDDGNGRDTRVAWCGGPPLRHADWAGVDTSVWGTLELVTPCASFLATETGPASASPLLIVDPLLPEFKWSAGTGFIYDGFWPFIYTFNSGKWYYCYCSGFDETGYYIYDFDALQFGWTGVEMYPYYHPFDGELVVIGE